MMLARHVCLKAPNGVVWSKDGKTIIAAPIVLTIWPDEPRCFYCKEPIGKECVR